MITEFIEIIEIEEQLKEIEKDLEEIKNNIYELNKRSSLNTISLLLSTSENFRKDQHNCEEIRKELKLGIRAIQRKMQVFARMLSELNEMI